MARRFRRGIRQCSSLSSRHKRVFVAKIRPKKGLVAFVAGDEQTSFQGLIVLFCVP